MKSLADLPLDLATLTTDECAAVVSQPDSILILPVGSTEPHGPHLPLATDVCLAEESARRAVRALRAEGHAAVFAPSIAYGVTRFAEGFAGAISLSPALMEQLVCEVCVAYRATGFRVVCVTNHHLEPAHVDAISRGVESAGANRGGVVFANQLSRRWGRTLSAEFKRGDCHAGSYETSLMLAAERGLVHEAISSSLPSVPISLATAIRAGQSTFRAIGMDRAYTGSPAQASVAEGDEQYARLVEMIVTEVHEALSAAPA